MLEHFIITITADDSQAPATAQFVDGEQPSDTIVADATTIVHKVDRSAFDNTEDAPSQTNNKQSNAGQVRVLAHSRGIPPEQAIRWHGQVNIALPEAEGVPSSIALQRALPSVSKTINAHNPSQNDDTANTYYWLVRAWQTPTSKAIYHHVLLSDEALASTGGDLTPLLNLLDSFAHDWMQNDHDDTQHTIETLSLPAPVTWTLNKRVAFLEQILQGNAERQASQAEMLFLLLDALLTERQLTIVHYPAPRAERLALMHSLTMLLPSPARYALTFSTQTRPSNASLSSEVDAVALRFLAQDELQSASAERFVFDWQTQTLNDDVPISDYGEMLRALWEDHQGDIVTFAEALRLLDAIAFQMMPDRPLMRGLALTAGRVLLNRAAANPESTIATEALIEAMLGNFAPQGDLYRMYVIRLLENALNERDTYAAEVCARALDTHPEFDDFSAEFFQNALEEQPDGVYAFVRARCNMSSTEPADERWLARLRQAALRSLNLALHASDADALAAWLRLLSREPQTFGLGDIVRDGILRAVSRAQESPLLVRTLLIIALKRAPDLLEMLLRDPNIVPTLPEDDPLRHALLYSDPIAIEGLGEETRELFLLAVGSALEGTEPTITSAMIRTLWELRDTSIVIIDAYAPLRLLERMPQMPQCLQSGALETLLRLWLSAETDDAQDARFYAAAEAAAEHDALAPLLARVLLQSGRDIDALLIILNQLIAREALMPAGQIAVAVDLLAEMDWQDNTLALAELLARWLNQHSDVTVSSKSLWRMLEFAERNRSEIIVKVVLQRVLQEVDAQTNETQQIALVARCREMIQWNPTAQARFMQWWRSYCRQTALSDLQKFAKALATHKGMEDLHAIVTTTSAMRRTIGQRSLSDLAEHISITHGLLLALADNFDPENKQTSPIDTDTIGELLQARAEELSPDAQQVLVTNLRGLAQLITTMAENRSKPSLIRSNNTIERQLARGEQTPQSAIDLIKWMATYLEGQDDEA
jgi:hypothetical protein